VDAVVRDEDADAVVNAIQKCANTGNVGDGKIWSARWSMRSGYAPASVIAPLSKAAS